LAGGHGRPRKINNLKGIERQGYALRPARLRFKPQLLLNKPMKLMATFDTSSGNSLKNRHVSKASFSRFVTFEQNRLSGLD
jgi:hypothetical protein